MTAVAAKRVAEAAVQNSVLPTRSEASASSAPLSEGHQPLGQQQPVAERLDPQSLEERGLDAGEDAAASTRRADDRGGELGQRAELRAKLRQVTTAITMPPGFTRIH